jgi:AmmeMemoRadiSam system protein B
MNINSRPTAVAGMFYPESAAVLAHEIAQMLAKVPEVLSASPKAIIAPHAGYVYSGPVAASIYAALAKLRGTITRVVLLGPAHRVAVEGLALPSCTAFASPLGEVPLDQQSMGALLDFPQITVNDLAHAQEHSLEVQLPFLQSVLGEFLLIPLVVGRAAPQQVAEVLESLWGGKETLIVISSDLSHYLPYAAALEIDTKTARQIVNLGPDLSHTQACGASPVNGLLLAARNHGLQGKLIDLHNSGDTAGERSRVVGYGAFAFFESEFESHLEAERHVH